VLALLKTRRWVGFTAIVIVSIIGFGFLSRWQWDRADEHRVERLAISQAQVLQNVESVTNLPEFTRVQITGTYDNQDTRLVRQRPLDGGNGYWVMTPLETNADTRIWVIRGWVGASTIATEVPDVPLAQTEQTVVSGAVRNFEDPLADVYGLPEGVIAKMSVEELTTPGFVSPFDNRVVQLISSTPSLGEIIIVPLPEVDEGQNISYAVQWILFALVAMIGWFIFLRREAETPSE
jgi:cytochrome oxidase assembly protein ShyY1